MNLNNSTPITTSNLFQKIFFIIRILILIIAAFGILTFMLFHDRDMVLRFQYYNFPNSGLVRFIADVIEFSSLIIFLMSELNKHFIKDSLKLYAGIGYSVFILIDTNSWLFLRNSSEAYDITLIAQGLPLLVIAQQLQVFKNIGYPFLLIAGIIFLLSGIIWRHYFFQGIYAQRLTIGFYYNYPTTLRLMAWLYSIGIFLIAAALIKRLQFLLPSKKPNVQVSDTTQAQ